MINIVHLDQLRTICDSGRKATEAGLAAFRAALFCGNSFKLLHLLALSRRSNVKTRLFQAAVADLTHCMHHVTL